LSVLVLIVLGEIGRLLELSGQDHQCGGLLAQHAGELLAIVGVHLAEQRQRPGGILERPRALGEQLARALRVAERDPGVDRSLGSQSRV
jgi:hypothetical protein